MLLTRRANIDGTAITPRVIQGQGNVIKLQPRTTAGIGAVRLVTAGGWTGLDLYNNGQINSQASIELAGECSTVGGLTAPPNRNTKIKISSWATSCHMLKPNGSLLQVLSPTGGITTTGWWSLIRLANVPPTPPAGQLSIYYGPDQHNNGPCWLYGRTDNGTTWII